MTEARVIADPGTFTLPPADVALAWARMGFPVFPCGPDKRPLTSHGFKDASPDLHRVAGMWQAHPTALIGLPTGDVSGIFVIDLDTVKTTGEAAGEMTLAGLGYPELWRSVPSVRTPSGGRHLYFRNPGLGSTVKRLGAGIDTRGNGGYVIAAGSVGPSGAYVAQGRPMRRETLPDLPTPLLDALRGNFALGSRALQIDTGAGFGADETSFAEVEEILSHIPASCGYADWLDVLMGLHDHFKGSAEGLDLAERWSAGCGAKYQPGEVAGKWLGFQLGGGIGWHTVCALARQNGADLSGIARRHKGRDIPALISTSGMTLPATGGGALPAKRRLERPKWCADLACNTLENDPAWDGVLAFDEFAGLTMMLQPIPGTTVPKSSFKPRPIRDTDLTAAVRWFNRNGYHDATRNTVSDAVYLVAAQTIISPVVHYLESVQWDGTPRAAEWLIHYCGAASSNLTRKVGQAWLVSAVARALQPGCKADCALVLEGRQGAGKSSVLRALAGDKWFHDGLSDMHSKDASAALKGKWIIELPELSAMRRSDTEAVKAFLSRTEERYRPAYGRAEVVEPRRCIFAGTTNRSDYLTDDTGGRRFWPVAVGAVRLADLIQDRDQLWAEAVALYRGGANWWLDREAEQEAAAVVADRAADDPWVADVLAAVVGLSEVSTRDVLQRLDVPMDRRGKADGMRVAGILTRAGWRNAGRFSNGTNRGLTRFTPPEGAGNL